MKTAALAVLGLASLFIGFAFNLILPDLRYYAWLILAVGAGLLAVAVTLRF